MVGGFSGGSTWATGGADFFNGVEKVVETDFSTRRMYSWQDFVFLKRFFTNVRLDLIKISAAGVGVPFLFPFFLSLLFRYSQ